MKNHKIVVIVPFYNARLFIKECVDSILRQKYSNYEVYLLDDCSEDNTTDLVDQSVSNLFVIRNERRMGATESIYRALTSLSLSDEDIIVRVDGDDYLFGEEVFQIIDHSYLQDNVLITYGQEIITNGTFSRAFLNEYTKNEFENVRSVPWKMPPLRTFKFKVFKELLKQDPKATHFKFSHNGQFYFYTSDIAFMFPLMEIAGYENSIMLRNVLYCYRHHPNNDHATLFGRNSQFFAESDIRSKTPLKRVF